MKEKVTQSSLTLATLWTIQLMEFSRPEYWPFPSPGDLPNPGIEPRSPALPMDSLPAELPGQPKNTGMDSLSLLQGVFPIQELNRGLLHCRRILYQLTYQGSPTLGDGTTCLAVPEMLMVCSAWEASCAEKSGPSGGFSRLWG